MGIHEARISPCAGFFRKTVTATAVRATATVVGATATAVGVAATPK